MESSTKDASAAPPQAAAPSGAAPPQAAPPPEAVPPQAAGPSGAGPSDAGPSGAADPPRAASPKVASPKAASPKAASPKAASPRPGSPMAIATSPSAASPSGSSPAGAAPVTTYVHPEVEAAHYSSNESAYSDSDLESFTTSLTSSVTNYQYENGRRYHAFRPGQYILPNDDQESDRLDLSHHLMTLALNGRLHASPLENPQKILDIGTGTGIWAIEMADAYPSAHVIGNDLSAIQPKWVPPNASFEIDDVESVWTHDANSFDLIYCRYMLGSIQNWKELFRQAFCALKPGAYLELLEPDSTLRCDDNSIPKDAPLQQWTDLFIGAADIFNRSVNLAPQYVQMMEEVGFVDIQENISKLPNSPWPKDKHLRDIGGYQMVNFLEALEGLSLRLFTNSHHMPVEQIQILLAKVRRDLRNKSIHTYFHLHSIVARKPLTE
ncbi:hypothetical protein DRE_00118 [Drechslerella stenobrocha 248]|uniref:Methyltransferase domain-containing protein n=1 Tax=Drechslerella stenobrocha 248 TaxID=1043628 RepID=W7I918_9PEZI|nr:hypothetical protein DRE_00118 [Drechslerella stenobrocha 248]